MLINVNYIESYYNEKRQDSAVKVMNESAIVSLDEQLNIHKIYPLRFRDSLRFDDFIVNAYAHCVFQINGWDDIILSISQKEESEKHILCRMEKSDLSHWLTTPLFQNSTKSTTLAQNYA